MDISADHVSAYALIFYVSNVRSDQMARATVCYMIYVYSAAMLLLCPHQLRIIFYYVSDTLAFKS